MGNKLKIGDLNISVEGSWKELSAMVDGEKVFFRVPRQQEIFPAAEPFVGIALLDAMASNRPISLEGACISKELFHRLREIQEIYSCWNRDLKIVDIYAETSSEVLPFQNVGSFFSAGVDSTHTLSRHIGEISHLIIFKVFDYGNDDESWEKRIKKQTEFAHSINKILVPVTTNAREWIQARKISWLFAHGLFLSSVGSAFQLKKSFIPSSHTYDELFPWGSHPLSDPLWSTESTQVIHDGAGFRRSDKIREILDQTILAENLQTCWMFTHKNCGRCPKCVRSVLASYLLGKEIKSLPKFQEKTMLKSLKAYDENGATFLEDAMLLAKNTNHPKIYKKLKNYYRLYHFKNSFISIDRYLLENSMRYIYRKIKKPKWLDLRVTLRGKYRWEV